MQRIVLPIDTAVTNEYTNDEEYRVKKVTEIAENEMGLDIGPATKDLFAECLKDASVVVWNGPLGVYEFSKYKKHTDELLKYMDEKKSPFQRLLLWRERKIKDKHFVLILSFMVGILTA